MVTAPQGLRRSMVARAGRGRHCGDGAADGLAARACPPRFRQVTNIFENVGIVQEGMMTIAQRSCLRRPAGPRAWPRGEIVFEDVRFGYGRVTSTAKTDARRRTRWLRSRCNSEKMAWTAARRRHRLWSICCASSRRGGRILIDGQDIGGVTQEACAQI
jgi:ATP-binding cassette subfamily B multidrug efflux pump